ncbi:MAG: pilus assembly protein, partial [Panacagrimonas sp.]
ALTTPTQLLPPFQGKEIYAEITHYLAGDTVYNAPLSRWDGLTGLLTRDTSIESGSRYVQPPAQCDTVNVLNIQLTNAARENESDADLLRYYPGAASASGPLLFEKVVAEARDPGFQDGAGNKISLNSHFVIQENLSSLAALANVGINATTYINNLGLLNLGKTVAEFLQPVLIVDASMLTPSLAGNPATPGRLVQQTGGTPAFFSSFRPEREQKPRWPGNLKKLRLRSTTATTSGVTSTTYGYVDAQGNPAIAADGRIDKNALTFWTSSALLGTEVSDGRNATLGGAGQRIPGYTVTGGGNPGRANGTGVRALYYDRYAGTSLVPSLAALNPDDAAVRTELRTALGASSDTQAQELLLYARGYEVGTTATPLGVGSGLAGRPWLHGAVLHSRPVAVNYGARTTGYTAESPDIRIVYGATDGYLRMVQNSTSGGGESGVENWGFMPRAVMDQQKTLRDNAASARFPYGVDGAPTVLLRDRDHSDGPADGKIESTNAYDRASVYFGLRRGGAGIYALDIKNPDSPSLLWRIGTDGLFNSTGRVVGSDTLFTELAQTFSSPQAGRVRLTQGSTSSIRSVVIFAGGYNGGRDASNVRIGKDAARGSKNQLGVDDGLGNAIYMVDAQTGELIWKARQGAFSDLSPFDSARNTFTHPLLVDSIAADTTVVDSDGDGLLDRLYALDTGGRLWRADFAGGDRSKWTLTPLVSVGRHDNGNVANDRRFFQAPDYAPFRDSRGAYDAVVFASGNREDPFSANTENYLYVFRDRDISSGKTAAQVLTSESSLTDQNDFADLTSACASAATNCGASADGSIGWKLNLTGRGEKAMSQPLTTGGTVFFTSYIPQDPTVRTCVPDEGRSRLYGVSLADSRPVVQS